MPADPSYRIFLISVFWAVAGFASYYLLAKNELLSRRLRNIVSRWNFHIIQVVLQRTWGVVFLGIFSGLIIKVILNDSLIAYGLGFSFSRPPPWWAYLILPLIMAGSHLQASRSANLSLYPQFRIMRWTSRIFLLNAITWILFLIAYEFLFRGFLLFGSMYVLEPRQAVLLNCLLYALAHLYKGPTETIGAIPFGVLLCYLTLITGNIWSAVVIHSFMALTNEWMSIRAHPGMSLVKRKNHKNNKTRDREGQVLEAQNI
ncbi:MAG: type II CAAX endopeptidase family protein [Bacteroidales bacterium]